MCGSRWEEWREIDPVGPKFLDVTQSLSHTIEVATKVFDAGALIFAFWQLTPFASDESFGFFLTELARGRKSIGEDLIEDRASNPTRVCPHRKDLKVLSACDVVISYSASGQPSISITIDQEEPITRLSIDDGSTDAPPLFRCAASTLGSLLHLKESRLAIVIDPKDCLLDREIRSRTEAKVHLFT